MKNYNVDSIKNLLTNAKTALIAVPQMNVDSIGAALSLALSLKKSKNINVKVFCPQKPDANYSKLSGLDLLTDTFQINDFVISLNYPSEQVEFVTYNDDGGKLNFVIKTKPDAPKIENDKIVLNNESSADISFMLGDESSLGANSGMVNKGNWVFVSPVNVSKSWAKASIIDADAPFSEIFTFLIPMLDLKLDTESAKDLLIGLRVATQSFSVNVSPETFEAGAVCLRATQSNDITSQINTTPIEAVEKPSSVSAI